MAGITKIRPTQARIKTAPTLEAGWASMVAFYESWLTNAEFKDGAGAVVFAAGPKKGVCEAWGGKGCDAQMMFQLTEETHVGKLLKPKDLDFFLDPISIIKHYKMCPLNESKTPANILGYGLEAMYCHVAGKDTLAGAHSALVDAHAQATVCAHPGFLAFYDRPHGIEHMEDVWRAKRESSQKKRHARRCLACCCRTCCVACTARAARAARSCSLPCPVPSLLTTPCLPPFLFISAGRKRSGLCLWAGARSPPRSAG